MLLIIAWPNRDPIISALHLMFDAIYQDRLTDVVSLPTVCEPDAVPAGQSYSVGCHRLLSPIFPSAE
jgi:hypothetical protein